MLYVSFSLGTMVPKSHIYYVMFGRIKNENMASHFGQLTVNTH